MKRITAVFSIVTVLFAAGMPAAAAELSTFKKLTAYASSGGFSLVFEFDGKPVERLRFSENHLQIDFSSSRMTTPKKIYDISRSGIATVEIAQSNQDTVTVLINPSVDVKTLGRSMSLEKRSGKLILRFAVPKSITASVALAAPVAPVAPAVPVIKKSDKVTPTEAAPKQATLKQKPVRPVRKTGRVSSLKQTAEVKDKTVTTAATKADKAATELQTALPATTLSLPQNKNSSKRLFADFSEPEIPAMPSLGESLVKVGGALAVVLAMVIILAFAAKRFFAGAETTLGTKKQLKVLSSHFIGVKKSVTIVEIAGEILALGVTNENINLLARYDDPEKIEQIKMTHRLPDRSTGIFKRLPGFSRLTGSKGGKKRGFSKEMDSRARVIKEREKKLAAKRDMARDELVSNAVGTIASRIRKMKNAAG